MKIEADDRFDEIQSAVEARGREALRAGAEHLQSEAQALTPKLSGELAGSLNVTVSGDEAAVWTDSPYAIKQHEKVGFRHTNGQAKFLETALLANGSEIEQAIAEALQLDT